MSFFRYVYLAYFSQPAGERFLYRGLRRWGCRSIVELGLGTGQRTERLLEQAERAAGGEKIRYTGIDLFEAREADSPGMTLKQAHQRFQGSQRRVQLAPGDPQMALSRLANTLLDTDLLLIQADQAGEALALAWYYVPRMLHEGSRVFVERVTERGSVYDPLSLVQVQQFAEQAQRTMRTRRAA